MAGRSRCADCGGLFEPLSRMATQIAMGPWFIRDRAKPFRPGCCYDELKRQIDAEKVTLTTIIRGPTTRQFWSVARNVPGVAHLLGVCHDCGAPVEAQMEACPSCQARFSEVIHRNELGLAYATPDDAEIARKALDRQLAAARLFQPTPPAADEASPAAQGAVSSRVEDPIHDPLHGPIHEPIHDPIRELRHAQGADSAAPEALMQLANVTGAATAGSGDDDARSLVAAVVATEQDDAEAVDQIPISAPPSGQALDFGPSETASAWRDLVRQVRPISWALIAVNLCLLGLLIVLFVSWLGTL